MKISDSQLAAILASLLDGTGKATITPANPNGQEYSANVRVEVIDNHRGDSPDVILWLTVDLSHPRLPTSLKLTIPVPIEGEKVGIGAALEDLRKFSEREHFVQSLPMLVVGGAGNPARKMESMRVPAKFEIIQIPYRAIGE